MCYNVLNWHKFLLHIRQVKLSMTKIKEKLIKFWAWLRKTVINKDMLLAIILAELIFWLPCIIVVVLAVAVDPMWWAVFGAIVLFWCAPFTPGWAIQIGLALIIKRVITRLKKFAKEAALKEIAKDAAKKAAKEAATKKSSEKENTENKKEP